MHYFFDKYGLTTNKQLTVLLLAGSFWLNGVFLIRLITEYSFWGGFKSTIIFALSIPIIIFCISGISKLLRLTDQQFSPVIIVIVAIVALLHGVALTGYPSIYGSDTNALMLAAAWLIWFCGICLISLVIMNKK